MDALHNLLNRNTDMVSAYIEATDYKYSSVIVISILSEN